MPALATYYIQNHKIEVVKTLFGRERVLLNGLIVSENFSDSKAEHHFLIGEDRYRISKRDFLQGEKMNLFKIQKNGSPIALINMESQNSPQMFLLIIAIGLGCGFIIGVLAYTMFLA